MPAMKMRSPAAMHTNPVRYRLQKTLGAGAILAILGSTLIGGCCIGNVGTCTPTSPPPVTPECSSCISSCNGDEVCARANCSLVCNGSE